MGWRRCGKGGMGSKSCLPIRRKVLLCWDIMTNQQPPEILKYVQEIALRMLDDSVKSDEFYRVDEPERWL